MPTSNSKDPGRKRRPLNQKPRATERLKARREREQAASGELNFSVRVRPGRCLLGINKKTGKDYAAAFKFEAETPHGRLRGWLIEENGVLAKIVPSWDQAEKHLRSKGMSVRLAHATG